MRTIFLMLASALLLGACGSIPKTFGRADEAEASARKMQELQLKVMRFADEYAGRVIGAANAFQNRTDVAADRLAAQNWKLQQCTSAYTIASGPNPITGALDMVVLATLSRMVMEDAWIGERFGEPAEVIRDAHRRLEPRAWDLVGEMLTDPQKTQLRAVIEDWRTRNPKVFSVAYIHFTDFARSIGQPAPGQALGVGSLFAVIGLDPLSNLDPAVQEIAQTRQLAERTIYYAQRAPNLIDMQVERLTYQFATMPETEQLLLAVDRAGEAAQRAGDLASMLPGIAAREREAAIAQFMDALYAQEGRTRALVFELRGALDSGTATSNSLNATIRSLDTLMTRFAKPGGGSEQATPPGKPFDITEYSTAARELAATTRELENLVRTLGASAFGVEQLKPVVDHLFWRTAQLLVLLVAAVLVAALGYRAIARRI